MIWIVLITLILCGHPLIALYLLLVWLLLR